VFHERLGSAASREPRVSRNREYGGPREPPRGRSVMCISPPFELGCAGFIGDVPRSRSPRGSRNVAVKLRFVGPGGLWISCGDLDRSVAEDGYRKCGFNVPLVFDRDPDRKEARDQGCRSLIWLRSIVWFQCHLYTWERCKIRGFFNLGISFVVIDPNQVKHEMGAGAVA
jgi:hypothetical protein